MRKLYAFVVLAFVSLATVKAQQPRELADDTASVSVQVDSLYKAWMQIDSSFHWPVRQN